MPQFPVTPSREKILARIPDYAVEIHPADANVSVTYDGVTIAETKKAIIIRETKHAEVFYLPREDVNMALFTPTDLSTYCPFKGHASYWNLTANEKTENNIVWSYESPYPEVQGLKDYMSFYTDRTELQVN